jgi:serine/threonine protein kinase
LAFAGNPFSKQVAIVNQSLHEIDWAHLTITNHLGEGASGMIAKATWRKKNDKSEATVAVKVFKGTVTSDGFPEDEMNACITAGSHPNLVEVVGKIKNHPEGKQGLVLGLIPPSFTNLGEPPSFASCTRDIFKSETFFTPIQIHTIVQNIADAAAHLHERGILHGDLYTHNNLVDEQATTLFGDFGAATRYERNNEAIAPYLERIEVQAFGYLLEDLLLNVRETAKHEPLFQQLWNLKLRCTVAIINERPNFASILTELTTMH